MKEIASRSWTSWSFSAILGTISRLNLAFLLTSLTIITLSLSDRYATSVARSIKVEQEFASRHHDHFWISSYLNWHAKNRNTSRVLVFRPTTEDLGRNVRRMIDLYAIAVLTNRLFLVNWTDAQPIADGISRRAYSRFVYHPTTVRTTVLRNASYQDVLEMLRGTTEVVAVDVVHRSILNSVVPALRDVLCKEAETPPFTVEVQRDVMLILLEPANDMLETIRILNSRVGLCVLPRSCGLFSWLRPSCAANTRRYIALYANSHGRKQIPGKLLDQETIYVRCVAQHVKTILESMDDTQARVFVVSNARFLNTFKMQLLRKFPEADVVHLDDWNYPGVGDKGRMIRQHVQMRIAGNAEHIISLESGFAKASFLIGNAHSSVIVSPNSCRL